MRDQLQEFPNVSIDNFENGNWSSTCFFLTHSHTDHTRGLQGIANHLHTNGYYLYCSPISREILLKSSYGLREETVIGFQGTELIPVPGSQDYEKPYQLTVTAIPAGHSPGSVMFLLEDGEKTVLFTGDFRIDPEVLPSIKQFEDYINGSKIIDKIYYDGTFCDAKYRHFPQRSESAKSAIEIIKREFDENRNYHVKIFSSAAGGYEDLLIQLSKEFDCKIHVTPKYYKIFSHLPDLDEIVTLNEEESQFHYYPPNQGDYAPEPNFAIVLKARSFTWNGSVAPEFTRVVKNGRNREYYVCYATHSSYSELHNFLSLLKGKSIESITESF